jgi:integrase
MARRRSTRRGRGEGTVFERANGTWAGELTVGYDENGRQKRKTVYGKTQAEALAKVGELKQQLSTGTFTDTKLTVKAYLERWLSHKDGQVKPRTAELYRHLAEYHILPKVGRKRLDKLTPLDVQGLISDIAASGSTRTANMCRTVLFSALKQAIRWQLLVA